MNTSLEREQIRYADVFIPDDTLKVAKPGSQIWAWRTAGEGGAAISLWGSLELSCSAGARGTEENPSWAKGNHP